MTTNQSIKLRKAEESLNTLTVKISKNFKVLQPTEISISFDQLFGHKEVKKNFINLLRYLDNPTIYEKYGKIPYFKYLIVGQHGVGKSTLVCGIAKKANIPVVMVESSFFFNTNGILEELNEIFAEVYLQLGKNKNCILLFKDVNFISTLEPEVQQPFIEKLIGYLRELPTLVAFCTIFSEQKLGISAQLVEPPAFTRTIEMTPPNLKTREQIIEHLLVNVPKDSNLNINRLALDTHEMSFGDIKILINDATLLFLQNDDKFLTYHHFAETLAQSNFGNIRSILNDEERLATARHEAGHVIAGYFSSKDTYKVSKVEILPRSFYSGITEETANEDKHSYFKHDLEHKIITCFGGMASEQFYYQSTTSGVANDLEQATIYAIQMIKSFGMDEDIGPVCLTSDFASLDELDDKADVCIQYFLKKLYAKTLEIIKQNSQALEALTQALLEKEVLFHDEIMEILQREYNN